MKSNIEKIVHSFIRFNYSKRTTELFYRWMMNNDSETEKDVVFRNLWSKTKGDKRENTDESFQQVLDKIGVEVAPVMRVNRFPVWKYVAAAAVIMFLSVSATLWLTQNFVQKDTVAMVEHYVGKGKKEKFVLPDGTVAHLNSASYIFYPDKLQGPTRTVYLVGEGNFEVAKDPKKPFIVRSADLAVTALGTEFNIKAYPEENSMIATLIEGKVKIDCNNAQNYMLSAGQQIIYNKNTKESRLLAAHVESVTAWQKGEIVFYKSSIDEMLQNLERHYGVEFRCPERKSNKDLYNFVFKEGADIREVLDIMKVVIRGFNYELNNNICYISWK